MFGEIVRSHRRRLGLSQEELSERSGIGVRSIGKIEAGRVAAPRPATVRLLADAFGLADADRDQFCRAASGEIAPVRRTDVPWQLPADAFGFTGRQEQLRRLTSLLERRPAEPGAAEHDPATAVPVAAIAGTAGVGKTALAVHWGHLMRHRFPDGQLYVNLRGFDASDAVMSPGEAVRRFLVALEVPPQRVPADLDAQTALYRSLLADRRMLVLLDNARDAGQVRPLLPAAPGCLVLVTSRDQLTSLVAADGAYPFPLDLLTPDEARELLARRIGAARPAAEPEAVDEIVERCARLPLALAIAAARAALAPELRLATLAGELRDRGGRFATLSTGDPSTDVRAVLSWSYGALTPAAARLFRRLGLHPGPDLSAAAAASLTGSTVEQVRSPLAELARAHLVVEHSPGRYTGHDLLRAYAAELARGTDSEEQRADATARMLDHYLHTAFAADRQLNPARGPIALDPPRLGSTVESPVDFAGALAWFVAERPTLLAVVGLAAEAGYDTHVWQLAWSLADYLNQHGHHWHDLAAVQSAAVAAAQRLGDGGLEARAHRHLAHALTLLLRYDDARAHYERALGMYQESGDQTGQAHAYHDLSTMYGRRGERREALEFGLKGLQLYQTVGLRVGQAIALNSVGQEYALIGEYDQALAHCEQALALNRELGYRHAEAMTLDTFGVTYQGLGRHAEALAYFQQAIDVFREVEDVYNEADTLTRLGETHEARGDTGNAARAWEEALAIFDRLDRGEADAVRIRLKQLRA